MSWRTFSKHLLTVVNRPFKPSVRAVVPVALPRVEVIPFNKQNDRVDNGIDGNWGQSRVGSHLEGGGQAGQGAVQEGVAKQVTDKIRKGRDELGEERPDTPAMGGSELLVGSLIETGGGADVVQGRSSLIQQVVESASNVSGICVAEIGAATGGKAGTAVARIITERAEMQIFIAGLC